MMPVRTGDIYKRGGNGRWVVQVQCEKCGRVFETRLDHYKLKMKQGGSVYCRSCANRRTHVKLTINTNLEDWQWAYIAGFLDGEGCLTFSRAGFPQLTASQVDRTPLDKMSSWLGAGKKDLLLRSRENPAWQDCWHWRVTNSIDILALLSRIHPYLSVKKHWLPQMVEYLSRRIDLNGYEKELRDACDTLQE